MTETNRERAIRLCLDLDAKITERVKLWDLFETALDEAEARGRESPRFKCKAAASSFPEPADCDWPFCWCDPHAERVLNALDEMGLEPHAVRRVTIAECIAEIEDLHKRLTETSNRLSRDNQFADSNRYSVYSEAQLFALNRIRSLLDQPADDETPS